MATGQVEAVQRLSLGVERWEFGETSRVEVAPTPGELSVFTPFFLPSGPTAFSPCPAETWLATALSSTRNLLQPGKSKLVNAPFPMSSSLSESPAAFGDSDPLIHVPLP
jgi:hypothetical protein